MSERRNYIFTSESVSEGHPDKVADRISDEVVDAFLGADPVARVACETMVTTNRIILAGEVRGPAGVIASGPRVSPASTTRLVVTNVSQATRAYGSAARKASRTVSLIRSATLSG